jgi:hypothetical protein
MASTTTYGTRMGITIGVMKEDLSDIIANISPVDTPFLNAIGKSTCTNTTPNWLVDDLAAAASNAAVEGADVSTAYTARSGAVRLANATQILTKLVEVSSTVEASDTAGGANKMKYQLGIKLKEFARDSEYALLNAEYSAGTASTARQMRSVVGDGVSTGWLNSATYYGSGTLQDFSAAYSATNDLTETIFNTQIQAAWSEGGKPDLVLASPTQKRIISGFYGNTKAAVNMDAGDKKVVNVVDVYESDFGMVKIVPERFFRAVEPVTGVFYDFVAILQKSLFEVCYLAKPSTEKMAKVGLSDRAMISAEMTLKAKAPKGNALIQRLSRS